MYVIPKKYSANVLIDITIINNIVDILSKGLFTNEGYIKIKTIIYTINIIPIYHNVF